MSIPDELRDSPLFYDLFDSEIEKLVKHCAVYSYNSGGKIVKDGDQGDQIFIILSGTAMVEKQFPGGRTQIQLLQTGDVFGEMALMDEKRRNVDVVCQTPCSVLEIRHEEIFRAFKKDPRIFAILMLNVSRMISKRLEAANQIIMALRLQRKAS